MPFKTQKKYRSRFYDYSGLLFETIEEVWTAELLIAMRIRFMHHVQYPLAGTHVSPDFTLERMFQWVTTKDDPHHGASFMIIEVKQTVEAIHRHRAKYDAIEQEYGFPTLLLSGDEIQKYLQIGALPIVALQAA